MLQDFPRIDAAIVPASVCVCINSVVRVVGALGDHDSVRDALLACDIEESRWPSFVAALESLARSGMLREHALAG